MSELYTSLSRLKEAMSGNALPAMTPLPSEALQIIEPDFTPGLGSLEEDERNGLRCPVRDCGEYHHSLRKHLNSKHAGIGGANAVLGALSIPKTAVVVSKRMRHGMKAARKGNRAPHADIKANATRSVQLTRAETLRETVKSVQWRNARNTCEAQVKQKMAELRIAIGHVPDQAEALSWDTNWVRRAIRIYGSWNAVKALCGMPIKFRGGAHNKRSQSYVLEVLRLWHEANGDLPTRAEALEPIREPMTPAPTTILRAMETGSWVTAMQKVARLLHIESARYGVLDAMPTIPRSLHGIVLTVLPENRKGKAA